MCIRDSCDSFGVDFGLVKGDALPVGNLRPDEEAIAVGGALHSLVVGVVGEADVVGVELFDPAEEGGDVLVLSLIHISVPSLRRTPTASSVTSASSTPTSFASPTIPTTSA